MKYELVLRIHTMVGAITLFSFWTAASARKGSKIHRTAGKIYLWCIVLILISVVPMIMINIQNKNFSLALALGFLSVMTFAAAWVARQSIARKHDLEAYKSKTFKFLAGLLMAFGILVLAISIKEGSFLIGVFACTGMTLAASMWHIVMAKNVERGWHLSQHLNGVALLFAATHASFLRFGLTKLIPLVPDTTEFNTIAQTSVIILALILRLTIGKRFLQKRSHASTQLKTQDG